MMEWWVVYFELLPPFLPWLRSAMKLDVSGVGAGEAVVPMVSRDVAFLALDLLVGALFPLSWHGNVWTSSNFDNYSDLKANGLLKFTFFQAANEFLHLPCQTPLHISQTHDKFRTSIWPALSVLLILCRDRVMERPFGVAFDQLISADGTHMIVLALYLTLPYFQLFLTVLLRFCTWWLVLSISGGSCDL